MHLRILLRDLPSLEPGPDHERVHRPLNVLHLRLLRGRAERAAEANPHGADTRATRRRRTRHTLHTAQGLREGAVAHVAAGSVIKRSHQLVTPAGTLMGHAHVKTARDDLESE